MTSNQQGSTSYSANTEGFRFHPIDRELMKYLLHFVIDKKLPTLVPIEDKDLYSKEPWLFFDGKKEKTLYFFTELKKKKRENTRFVRSVGKGSWKSQDKGKAVCSEKGSILGYKRSLRYQHSGSPHDGQWLMKEYSLCEEVKKKLRQLKRGVKEAYPQPPMLGYNKENYVLCRVKRKRGEDPIAQKETIETEELKAIIGDPPTQPPKVTPSHPPKVTPSHPPKVTLTLFNGNHNP